VEGDDETMLWRVRDFERGDQDAVRALVLQGMAERWGEAFRPDANPDVDDIYDSYVARGAEVLVAERAGAIVGTGTLVEVDAATGRVRRMAVRPDQRRQGLGRALVAALIDRSRARGHSQLLVSTDPPWTEAIALYRSCGFQLIDEIADEVHFTMDLHPG
jgi:GNAT superfamily N-acetyltransferase